MTGTGRARDSGFAPVGGEDPDDGQAPEIAAMSWFALLAAVRKLGFEGRTKAEALEFLRQRGLLET